MNTTDSRKGYAQVVKEHVQGEFKTYIGIGVSLIAAYAWLQTAFVPMALGKEMMAKTKAADDALTQQVIDLATEVKASNNLLLLHMKKEKYDKVLEKIEKKEDAIWNLEQWIEVNGSNAENKERLKTLKAELKALIVKRDCIINANKLCD